MKKTWCIIWMHGLGASSADMQGLAQACGLPKNIHHIFLDAPTRPVTINQGMHMPAWYDVFGFDVHNKQDTQGIEASRQIIEKTIQNAMDEKGCASEHIFLAGFSQGGAMALYTGLKSALPLGGIISLSGYVPVMHMIEPQLPISTPFFLGHGQYDPIVPSALSDYTYTFLAKHGYNQVTRYEYPIEHNVSDKEIHDVQRWVLTHSEGHLT
jgi:phospholipase/carboxylesterase